MFQKFGKEMIPVSLEEAVKKVMDEDEIGESGLRMAAHAAHKAGKSHFNFQGKSYPVNVKEAEAEGTTKKYEMMHQNGQVKRFVAKDDADAKRIAAGHGAKSVIRMKSNVPGDKIGEQGVAESGDKYKIKSIGSDVDKESGERRDYYISPSTGKKVYKSGVNKGDHEVPKTGEIKKKINEAEPDYKSSAKYRGKVGDFKPKASDVGQGRKIAGKMGKYGKQPDDDEKMVEPPKDQTVGAVKTDPSAVVPGHSTMAAKLHLASLPKDKEGNPIIKGARKVSAADLVAKRKAMMSQKNEAIEDTLHPAGAALLKHIKPQHHNLYKPHLTKDTFNGSYGDRTAVLKAAKDAGHLKMDLRKQNEEVEQVDEATMTHITLGKKIKNDDGGHNQDVHYKGKKIGSIESYKHRTGLRYGGKHDATGDMEAGSRSPEEAINFVRTSHADHLKSMKEEVESITEGKMDKMTLTGLWHKHAQHSYAADQGYGHGENSMKNNEHAATAIENHVRKHYGNKVANDMVSHSEHHVSWAEYAGPESSHHHEKEAEKLRKKHGVHGDFVGDLYYGESVSHVTERVDPNVRTTDTLKGRIAGGEPNQHSSYKVKLETKGTGAMDRIKSAAKSAFDRVKNETMMGKAGATTEAKKLDKEGY